MGDMDISEGGKSRVLAPEGVVEWRSEDFRFRSESKRNI